MLRSRDARLHVTREPQNPSNSRGIMATPRRGVHGDPRLLHGGAGAPWDMIEPSCSARPRILQEPSAMPDTLTNSKIVAAYRERTPKSAELAAQAQELLPSGIAHDARYMKPYGIYVDHAKGPRKWDVDGNEYVDYFGGHGALL